MENIINQRQEKIIEEFSVLDGDQEMTIFYIMELGQKLPDMDEEEKTEQNLVKGCQSKVWLMAHLTDGKVTFNTDSNTAITKGLASLLVRVFNNCTPDEILQAEIYFPERIGMNRYIGTQRSNGFGAMIKQFKLFAIALKTKLNV
ncbi:MAG: SufE family protein [Cyclobacteriaceae bacterium]|nr:SufE family protein [Cyclobacteriaceae bacterium]